VTYREFHRRSIEDRDGFWRDEAKLIHWHKPFGKVLDYSRPPFARWFVGGETNLCHNALDRHLAARAGQKALVWISTEVNEEKHFTYGELHAEVNRAAAMMQALGVKRGDRVIIYMPMIPEACFAILACARIGAIHSVVFGGFAASSLAAAYARCCAAGRRPKPPSSSTTRSRSISCGAACTAAATRSGSRRGSSRCSSSSRATPIACSTA
jgi:propionyl-CoA synthetase